MTLSRVALERQLEHVSTQLARLDSLPKEPTDYEPVVLHWKQRFTGSFSHCDTVYTYAAIRCPDNGLWYTTGPKSPKGYTWEQFASWMLLDNEVVDGLWLATHFERVA